MVEPKSEKFSVIKATSMWPILPILLLISYLDSSSLLIAFLVSIYVIWLATNVYIELDYQKVSGPSSGIAILLGQRKTIFLKEIDMDKSFNSKYGFVPRIVSIHGKSIILDINAWISTEEVNQIKNRIIELRG